MITTQYFPGSSIYLTATFTDPVSGILVDPTTVTIKIQAPDGTLAAPSATRLTVGEYRATYVPAVSGTFTQRWEGVGSYPQVSEAQFVVLPSGIL